MSHYDKKIEDYEDALFALLMDRLSEEEGEKYKLLNEQLKMILSTKSLKSLVNVVIIR